MSLRDIPVKVESDALQPDQPTGMAQAILREVAAHLQTVAAGGERQIIDLRGLPLTRGDYRQLEQALGRGEVSANVEAAGPTEVFETRYPGVWWVRYQNLDGQVVAEQLEVARVPTILETPVDDLRASARDLAEVLDEQESTNASL